MHIEPRLLAFTRGVRARIAGAVLIGLLAIGLGIARLALLGWLIGQVFSGRPFDELVLPALTIALVMVLRGLAEHHHLLRGWPEYIGEVEDRTQSEILHVREDLF